MTGKVILTYICIIQNEQTMKKFDFRRQFKGMDLQSLKELRNYHVDQMLRFIGYNDKASSLHSRYISYIDQQILKLTNQ